MIERDHQTLMSEIPNMWDLWKKYSSNKEALIIYEGIKKKNGWMVLFPHRGGRVTTNNVQYISKEAGLSSILHKFKREAAKTNTKRLKIT